MPLRIKLLSKIITLKTVDGLHEMSDLSYQHVGNFNGFKNKNLG